MPDSKIKILFIVGPTATGKSDLALKCSQKFGWPIFNCDSVQTYKEVDIGTAKPSLEERSLVPHELFDFVEAGSKLTAADYLKEVKSCLGKYPQQNIIFVGGSGFYIQALQKGLVEQPDVPADVVSKIEKWVSEKGWSDLYAWLQKRDPEHAAKISTNDHYRIRRACEILFTQDRSISELKEALVEDGRSILPPHRSLVVGINDDRAALRERVEVRTRKMLEAGFVEEVRSLLERGYAEWAPMLSVGYKEVQSHLRGDFPKEQLSEKITTATMQLIKKQQTWFKRDKNIQWFTPQQMSEAQQFIESWSNS